MTDLPRSPIDPLPAPEGAYDGVAIRARSRRTRSALLAGGLVLAVGVGSTAVTTLLATDRRSDALVADDGPSPSPGRTASPTPSPVPSDYPGPAVTPSAATPSPAPSDQRVYRGRVVDSAGRPVAGIYVASFNPRSNGIGNEHDAVTGADGTFETVCELRLLLSTWMTGTYQTADTRNLAATWVGGGRTFAAARPVPCSEPGTAPVTTTMPVGGTVEGAFRSFQDGAERPYADGSDPGSGIFCDALGLSADAGQCASWTISGGRYRFAGLPTGRYTLQTTLARDRAIDVVAGEITLRDWDHCLECTGGRPNSDPTQSPARSGTPHPSPSLSPSVT